MSILCDASTKTSISYFDPLMYSGEQDKKLRTTQIHTVQTVGCNSVSGCGLCTCVLAVQHASLSPAEEGTKGGDSEIPLLSECDSGIGHSSGRMSALSQHSEGVSTIITIPDGNEERYEHTAAATSMLAPSSIHDSFLFITCHSSVK